MEGAQAMRNLERRGRTTRSFGCRLFWLLAGVRQASCCALTKSCSSLSCFPVSPPMPRSSSSSSGWALTLPEDGPCLIKNSSCWSRRSPCSIQAESCLYMTPWHTARILSWEKSKSLRSPLNTNPTTVQRACFKLLQNKQRLLRVYESEGKWPIKLKIIVLF